MGRLSAEMPRELHRVEPQSLAFLTEVGLDASTHPVLVAQLDRIIERLLDALPKTLDQWRQGVDMSGLKDVRVDHLGSVGTRLMLDRAGVPAPVEAFVVRATSTFPRGPSGDFSRRRSSQPLLADNTPQQRRIFAYAEYHLHQSMAPEGPPGPVEGRMLREHGFQGLRMWQKGWLRALTLPVNAHVDRSVCAEFQVLNELCDLAHQSGLADSMEECRGVGGSVRVLVSTTPCLSCVCAVLQFALLFPAVRFEFGCVQPWHSEGGPDGATREPSWTGDSRGDHLEPAIWEGGRIVTTCKASSPEILATAEPAESPEPLTQCQVEVVQQACRVKLGGGRAARVDLGRFGSWEEVQLALRRQTPDSLAEVLRGHRQAVRPETQPQRVEKILVLLKGLVQSAAQAAEESSACSPMAPTAAPSGHASLGVAQAGRSTVRWR
uniref:Uncharacterized protein n=1 Tax=Alexandrium monilatum TaxID=311494 RepID=A0A7S4UBC5_9DINO